jgi:CDP-diacylglycerol--glycerol-3-phosphate 3-phosphatidyltransferase
MNGEPRRVPVVNVANGLTAARIVLIPVFVIFVLAGGMEQAGWRIVACGAFVVASVTDYVDGWIARGWNLVTSFGKVADPIADKALTGTALVLLSLYGAVSWWVTAIILVREWGVTALRFWMLPHGVIPASRGGKAKTAVQSLAIGWYLYPFPAGVARVGPWLLAAAVVVTVVTGVDYVVRALRVRRDAAPGALASGAPVTDAALDFAGGPVTAQAAAPPSDEPVT